MNVMNPANVGGGEGRSREAPYYRGIWEISQPKTTQKLHEIS